MKKEVHHRCIYKGCEFNNSGLCWAWGACSWYKSPNGKEFRDVHSEDEE